MPRTPTGKVDVGALIARETQGSHKNDQRCTPVPRGDGDRRPCPHLPSARVLTAGVAVERETDLLSGELLDSMSVLRLAAFVAEAFQIDIQPGDFVIESFRNVARSPRTCGAGSPIAAMRRPRPPVAHPGPDVWTLHSIRATVWWTDASRQPVDPCPCAPSRSAISMWPGRCCCPRRYAFTYLTYGCWANVTSSSPSHCRSTSTSAPAASSVAPTGSGSSWFGEPSGMFLVLSPDRLQQRCRFPMDHRGNPSSPSSEMATSHWPST